MLQKAPPREASSLSHPTALALYNLRVIWTCMKKDIKVSLTERTFTIVGILVPINILFLMILFVIGGGYAPTAVEMNDRGPYAQQFYQAMSGAHSFRLQQTSAQEAGSLITFRTCLSPFWLSASCLGACCNQGWVRRASGRALP